MSSPAELLAAAKLELESHYASATSSLTRRSAVEAPSARERLAAARDQLEATFNGLTKRGSLSAADRLAAAKEGLEHDFGSAASALIKRDEAANGQAEMPVSNFQKTVMPIIIGLV